jgi:hypothetical protein
MLGLVIRTLHCNVISLNRSYNTFCLVLSVFFIVESLYLFYTEYNLASQGYNIVSNAWAFDINGTENGDNITGTQTKDIIKGLGGKDTIIGKGAGDDISGGSGDDVTYGNKGRDILWGKAGNDHIEGGKGNDRISGERGIDILMGDSGNDTITGGLNKDIFICGSATDTVVDFNITQKDTIPKNDCENIRYEGTKAEAQITTSSVLQQQWSNLGIEMDNIENLISNNNTISNDEKTVKNLFEALFFGLLNE